MSAETLDIFAGAINDIANGPRVSSFHGLTETLMRRLAEKGLTLAQLADRKMLNRSVSTLQGHCREYGIRFPDYVPTNMCSNIKFFQTGDYLELVGKEVRAVAAILDISVTERDGVDVCSIPARSWDECKINLRVGGFIAKKGKASKARKVNANG